MRCREKDGVDAVDVASVIGRIGHSLLHFHMARAHMNGDNRGLCPLRPMDCSLGEARLCLASAKRATLQKLTENFTGEITRRSADSRVLMLWSPSLAYGICAAISTTVQQVRRRNALASLTACNNWYVAFCKMQEVPII